MSRIHEALQKARQQELGIASGLPNVEEIITSKADFMDVVKAGDVGAGALPAGMLDSVAPPPTAEKLTPMAPALEEKKPRLSLVASRARGDWPQQGEHLVFFGSHVAGQEQFRTLRSRLHQMRRGSNLQVLAVSSALPNEGKSFVSANLAHAFALQCERGVLVIDADMRRAGGLSAALECPILPGLSEYLGGELGAGDVIHTGKVPKLFVIPCGRKVDNSGELIGTPKFAALIEKLRPMFDWIIVDTPPVIPIADARSIADLSDGVILVVNSRSTPAELATRAAQEFRRESLLGVVLNRASGSSRSYYSSYGYYYNYGSEERSATAK